MTEVNYENEIDRLHAFTMQLAERLAAASEVLTMLAERKDRRAVETQTPNRCNCDEEETI